MPPPILQPLVRLLEALRVTIRTYGSGQAHQMYRHLTKRHPRYRYFDSGQHLDEIMDINLSAGFRQGGQVSQSYGDEECLRKYLVEAKPVLGIRLPRGCEGVGPSTGLR